MAALFTAGAGAQISSSTGEWTSLSAAMKTRLQLQLLLLACLHRASCWRGPLVTGVARHAQLRCTAPAPDANEETIVHKKKRIKIAKRQSKTRKAGDKKGPSALPDDSASAATP